MNGEKHFSKLYHMIGDAQGFSSSLVLIIGHGKGRYSEELSGDIFISYQREQQAIARKLANDLERQGWTVWWDPRHRAGFLVPTVDQHTDLAVAPEYGVPWRVMEKYE
jgi:hypothetical protein